MVNRDLANCTEGIARTKAIGRNHALWSILVKDLALAENIMPEGIKANLITLGLWSMRYSTHAILNDLPVDPLIEVNENVLQGLMSQTAVSATRPPDAPFHA